MKKLLILGLGDFEISFDTAEKLNHKILNPCEEIFDFEISRFRDFV